MDTQQEGNWKRVELRKRRGTADAAEGIRILGCSGHLHGSLSCCYNNLLHLHIETLQGPEAGATITKGHHDAADEDRTNTKVQNSVRTRGKGEVCLNQGGSANNICNADHCANWRSGEDATDDGRSWLCSDSSGTNGAAGRGGLPEHQIDAGAAEGHKDRACQVNSEVSTNSQRGICPQECLFTIRRIIQIQCLIIIRKQLLIIYIEDHQWKQQQQWEQPFVFIRWFVSNIFGQQQQRRWQQHLGLIIIWHCVVIIQADQFKKP